MKTTFLTMILMFAIASSGISQKRFSNLEKMSGADTAMYKADSMSDYYDANLWQVFKRKLPENVVPMAFAGWSGAWEAAGEKQRMDFETFQRVTDKFTFNLVSKNSKWFDQRYSHLLKWKDENPEKGERWFTSTNLTVAATDFKHFANMQRNMGMFGAMATVRISIGSGKPVKYLLKESFVTAVQVGLANKFMFNAVLHGVYGHPVFKGKAGA